MRLAVAALANDLNNERRTQPRQVEHFIHENHIARDLHSNGCRFCIFIFHYRNRWSENTLPNVHLLFYVVMNVRMNGIEIKTGNAIFFRKKPFSLFDDIALAHYHYVGNSQKIPKSEAVGLSNGNVDTARARRRICSPQFANNDVETMPNNFKIYTKSISGRQTHYVRMVCPAFDGLAIEWIH